MILLEYPPTTIRRTSWSLQEHHLKIKREVNRRRIYECRCDERLKDQNWGIYFYMLFIHWVPWGTGTPKDRDKVNRREVCECDGWVCDLDATGASSIFKIWNILLKLLLFIMNRWSECVILMPKVRRRYSKYEISCWNCCCLLWIDEAKANIKPIYECRCNGRLQTKRSTRLSHTG